MYDEGLEHHGAGYSAGSPKDTLIFRRPRLRNEPHPETIALAQHHRRRRGGVG
jgi:hypothetical protein